MNYIIYPDVLFLVNFLMDYIVLRGMNTFLNCSAKKLRCIFGALLGATYSCLMLVMPSGYYFLKITVTYIVISYLMILIAFGKCNFKESIKRFVLLYIITYLLSGIMNGLYLLWGVKNIITTIVVFIILKVCLNIFSHYTNRKSMYYDVVIEIDNKKISIRAFLDTGNSLREPISGKPVNIVEKTYIDKLIEDIDISTKYRYIPFHSIGEDRGALDGIEADYLYIGKTKIIKPILAIYEGRLSAQGEYNMLLNIDEKRL